MIVGVLGVVIHKWLLGRVDHAKEPIHGLEGYTLGFGDEEPDEEEHREAEAAEDEVGSGAKLVSFLSGEFAGKCFAGDPKEVTPP